MSRRGRRLRAQEMRLGLNLALIALQLVIVLAVVRWLQLTGRLWILGIGGWVVAIALAVALWVVLRSKSSRRRVRITAPRAPVNRSIRNGVVPVAPPGGPDGDTVEEVLRSLGYNARQAAQGRASVSWSEHPGADAAVAQALKALAK